MKKLLFENVPCSRCGGSGRMPFAVMNGICFKCSGAGAVLTKRGQAAQNFLDGLRHRRADELKVGDLIFSQGFSAGSFAVASSWGRIVSIEPTDNSGAVVLVNGVQQPVAPGLKITTTVVSGGQDSGIPAWGVPSSAPQTSDLQCSVDHMVRIGFSKEEKAAQREQALAFQATLTKSGTVRKAAA